MLFIHLGRRANREYQELVDFCRSISGNQVGDFYHWLASDSK
jgi:hypothetical protein